MPKKLSKNIEYFEDYRLLAIVSNIKDYSLCFHINGNLKIDFVKHDDLFFDLATDVDKGFSWYYYFDSRSRSSYYLIGNRSEGSLLLSSQKTVDYFLLIKDYFEDDARKIANSLRKITYISAIYDVNMQQVKNLEPLLETIELHELEVVNKTHH